MILGDTDDEEIEAMFPVLGTTAVETRSLPPLILHPFSDSAGPGKLVESSRASLMLQGLLPTGDFSQTELETRLVDGRYCEIRMLYYVGKDVNRWIEQCLEQSQRSDDPAVRELQFQSFADFLVNRPPKPVKEKLKRWGVADYRAIFSRAIGLFTVFAEVPQRQQLSVEFVKQYYRYADQMFACRQQSASFREINHEEFDFDLFASAEYSRMLEREWEAQ
jgi:hypothetical protein